MNLLNEKNLNVISVRITSIVHELQMIAKLKKETENPSRIEEACRIQTLFTRVEVY